MVKTEKIDRVNAILDVAETHIRRGGFNAVSFRDIATEVGIKSSSVHYHFPHKYDLGRAVMQRYAERFGQLLGSPTDPKESPAQKIKKLGEAYMLSLKMDKAICLGCVLGAEASGLPQEVQTTVAAFFNQLVGWTKAALGDADGPAADAHYIIGALQGAMVLSIALGEPKTLEETVTRLSQSV